MTARSRTGDDPTRTQPGGSRTETKITEQSELGSDRAGDDQVNDDNRSDRRSSRRGSRSGR